jgi:RNA polymerase sigma factor (sigma-70 family)
MNWIAVEVERDWMVGDEFSQRVDDALTLFGADEDGTVIAHRPGRRALYVNGDLAYSDDTPMEAEVQFLEGTNDTDSTELDRLSDQAAPVARCLNTVAKWLALIGLPDESLFQEEPPPGTPQRVLDALAALAALRPRDLLNSWEANQDAAELLDQLLTQLDDPREFRILSGRLFATQKETLDEIGQELGLTRERVRQIEKQALENLRSLLSDDNEPVLCDLLKVLRSPEQARLLEDVAKSFPALLHEVPSLQQPVWLVLDRLIDEVEIIDGWVVQPDIATVKALTEACLDEGADAYGVAQVNCLDSILPTKGSNAHELRQAWAQYCGYVIDDNLVLTRTRSVQDYAAAVLAITGQPLSTQEIVDRFVFERNARSLGNQLSSDPRFNRVDRDRWALVEWGLETYSGIREAIRDRIDLFGGSIKLAKLVELLRQQFSVSESSVVAYASAPPYQCRDGVVTVSDTAQEATKPPERTRRLFRASGGWMYRIHVTPDHMRGSGYVAPMAVASILGMSFGETRHLDSPKGPQAIAWTGIQPSFGTIRKFLLDTDIEPGDEAFLVIKDDGTFDFVRVPTLSGEPLRDALVLAGQPATSDPEEACRYLIQAIKLPDSSPITSIIGGYKERGDDDIADLVFKSRDALSQAPSHRSENDEQTEIDDILRLL